MALKVLLTFTPLQLKPPLEELMQIRFKDVPMDFLTVFQKTILCPKQQWPLRVKSTTKILGVLKNGARDGLYQCANSSAEAICLGTSKTAWRNSLCIVSRCRGTPQTPLSDPQSIPYMTLMLLLGTERPALYSLARLSPCCNSQDRWAEEEAKTHARIYLCVKFLPQYKVLIYRFSFQESQGCCCPVHIRRASSGTDVWGKHTPFIAWQGEYFQSAQYAFTLLSITSWSAGAFPLSISWLLPVTGEV